MHNGDERNLPASLTKDEIEKFTRYLLKDRKRQTVALLTNYARRHYQILLTGDASELLWLSTRSRHHAMHAVACLSKYYGCYSRWKDIKERYDLKWTVTDGLQVLQSIMNNGTNYTAMKAWLIEICSQLPDSYANILIYATLTGLRPTEACQSISLLHSDHEKYLNTKEMLLEHYKYPEIFIRKTKKAYISTVTADILDVAGRAGEHGYYGLNSAMKRRKLVPLNMYYCRKIFATYLRMKGVESEFIDILQGRIPPGIFARHYFRPDFANNQKRIGKLLQQLYKEITSCLLGA